MAALDGIKLPNGRFVELAGIPDNVTGAEMQDKLIRNGLATIEEFKTPETPEDLNWLQKNMELTDGRPCWYGYRWRSRGRCGFWWGFLNL